MSAFGKNKLRTAVVIKPKVAKPKIIITTT